MRVLERCALSCNRNGVLVPFADIEARMRRIRGVAEAVIVEGEPNLRGRELIAVCLGEQQAVPSVDEVRIACLETMPAYAVPDRIRFVDRLPLLATGKVDRRRLAQDALEAVGR
jgi:acyl-CoA synthetase (AMP-forming)/AMP-acid ligase II